jgi:hypothetical protein
MYLLVFKIFFMLTMIAVAFLCLGAGLSDHRALRHLELHRRWHAAKAVRISIY